MPDEYKAASFVVVLEVVVECIPHVVVLDATSERGAVTELQAYELLGGVMRFPYRVASSRFEGTHVETPDEINDVFDTIAYQKTAAVVRMIEAYLGPDSYRTAINAYLRQFAFDNATGEDYWNTIAETSGKPVGGILRSYII